MSPRLAVSALFDYQRNLQENFRGKQTEVEKE